MAKDQHDLNTEDWIDDVEERREREIQEHARRQARKDKLRERQNGEASAQDSPRTRTAR